MCYILITGSKTNSETTKPEFDFEFRRQSDSLVVFECPLSQLDIVTALSVVANLEKRAQYDPQFRTSFPQFLRRNSWFL